MNLTWKDLITALITGLIGWVTYSRIYSLQLPFPFPNNVRWEIVIFLFMGMFMCAFGAGESYDSKNFYTNLAAILGVLAIIIALWGLITANKYTVIYLGIDIIVLWLIATINHLVGKVE